MAIKARRGGSRCSARERATGVFPFRELQLPDALRRMTNDE
jgi:hypothetical protein